MRGKGDYSATDLRMNMLLTKSKMAGGPRGSLHVLVGDGGTPPRRCTGGGQDILLQEISPLPLEGNMDRAGRRRRRRRVLIVQFGAVASTVRGSGPLGCGIRED